MKTQLFQARLWSSLTSELREQYFGQFYTPRMKDLESLYGDMCDKFESTLNDDRQKEAFHALLELVTGLCLDSEEQGAALGLRIAKELHDFLDDPEKAMRQANLEYNSVYDAHKSDREQITEYWESRQGRKGGTDENTPK